MSAAAQDPSCFSSSLRLQFLALAGIAVVGLGVLFHALLVLALGQFLAFQLPVLLHRVVDLALGAAGRPDDQQ